MDERRKLKQKLNQAVTGSKRDKHKESILRKTGKSKGVARMTNGLMQTT